MKKVGRRERKEGRREDGLIRVKRERVGRGRKGEWKSGKESMRNRD